VADSPIPKCRSLVSRKASSIVNRRPYKATTSAAVFWLREVAMHQHSCRPSRACSRGWPCAGLARSSRGRAERRSCDARATRFEEPRGFQRCSRKAR
jgi:hypothetical protein